MLHTKQEQKSHLSVIVNLLATYQVLTIKQLDKLFPELSEEKVLLLIKQLERKKRIAYHPDSGYVCHSRECIPSHSRIAAFWVMLDFQPHVTFHTVSEFPITLTFYTKADGFNIIHVPIGKEMLIIDAATCAERLACSLRNLIFSADLVSRPLLMENVSLVHGISIHHAPGIVEITLPGLMPKLYWIRFPDSYC